MFLASWCFFTCFRVDGLIWKCNLNKAKKINMNCRKNNCVLGCGENYLNKYTSVSKIAHRHISGLLVEVPNCTCSQVVSHLK